MLVIPVGIGGWALGLQLTGNTHEVEAGELYRSAQIGGDRLSSVLRDDRIRTVINLEGTSPGAPWYVDETRRTAAAGAVHYDIGMLAEEEPSDTMLRQLIALLRTAPRPILVHCKSGADRTGLASALYELLVKHKDASTADRQLSFFYGHFPWLGSRTIAMDAAFEEVSRHPTRY